MPGKKKKITSKIKKKKILRDTKPEFCFKLIDGSEIKNLLELADALEKMSDDVFYYHVSKQKNDFSNWVRDVFKQEELANKISGCNNKQDIEINILRYLVKQ